MTSLLRFTSARCREAVLLALALALPAAGQSAAPAPLARLPELPPSLGCAPDWSGILGPEAGVGHSNYTLGTVHCAAVFDDGLGDGPVLFIGGRFNSIGSQSANSIARWDGTEWSTPPGPNSDVLAMIVHDDGSGPALFVGGSFTSADGVSASNIAKWDGTTWSALDSGVSGLVNALTTIPVGPGESDLVLAGTFTSASGVFASRVAGWDGSAFYAMGDGFSSNAWTLELHPPSGPTARVYAGGSFSSSGTTSINRLARFEPGSSSWVEVDGGVAGSVNDLESRLWGGTQTLLVGGSFSAVGPGGTAAENVASWTDSGGWTTYPGFVFSSDVRAVELFDDGGGDQLHIGAGYIDIGSGNQFCAKFDGADWQSLGPGTGGVIHELFAHDDGSGSSLWVGGQYYEAGDKPAKSLAEWDGSDWLPIEEGLSAFSIEVLYGSSLSGLPTLYMGGFFRTPTHLDSSGIAGWRNGIWTDMGEIQGTVYEILEWDDGSGPALYVGGNLFSIDGVPYDGIARWDGSTWSSVGGDVDGVVYALAVHDDGSGPALYAGGFFQFAGGVPAANIARWDGATWSAVDAGFGSGGSRVEDLIVWDDGGGDELYATGTFGPSWGVPYEGIASWDGINWTAVGGGFPVGGGRCLEVWDDGTGERLYLGGSFNSLGPTGTKSVARFDGVNWEPLDLGLAGVVEELEVFDDGTGESMFATGGFLSSGDFSAPLPFVARFDGSSWLPLGGGLNSQGASLVAIDDGSGAGPRLAVGGRFTVVNDLVGGDGAGHAAFWGHCWTENNWIDIGFDLPGTPGSPLLVGTGSLAYASVNTVNLSNALPLATAGLFIGFTFGPTPFGGGILVPVPFLDPVVTTTSATGTIPNSFVMPLGIDPGVTMHVQWVIDDSGGPGTYAFSNCVVGTTP